MRDECNVTFAADAFARLTHRIGICDVTVGPGCLKLPSGLMEAYYSSIPIPASSVNCLLLGVILYERGAALAGHGTGKADYTVLQVGLRQSTLLTSCQRCFRRSFAGL